MRSSEQQEPAQHAGSPPAFAVCELSNELRTNGRTNVTKKTMKHADASPHAGRDVLAQSPSAGAEQELTRELIAARSHGLAPESALAVHLSALRLTDPSPLVLFCARLQIIDLRSNMIAELPRARARRSHAALLPAPRAEAAPAPALPSALIITARMLTAERAHSHRPTPQPRSSASAACASSTWATTRCAPCRCPRRGRVYRACRSYTSTTTPSAASGGPPHSYGRARADPAQPDPTRASPARLAPRRAHPVLARFRPPALGA